jgi:putative endonuclease
VEARLSADGFAPGSHHRARGRVGEAVALEALRRAGYEILATNVSNRFGELDVVALDGDTLCFIEVKARASETCGSSLEAVDRRKCRRIARAAAAYLVDHPWNGPCRFDVVGLDPGPDGWRIQLVRDAFQL